MMDQQCIDSIINVISKSNMADLDFLNTEIRPITCEIDDISCNQYNYSTDYIYKDYLLPQEIGIITKGKGDSVQERMKSATIRFEKSCIEDKWKLKL